MRLWAAVTFLLILSYVTAFAEEEYSFDMSEIEEKPLDFGGYLEFRPVLFGLDRDSALYKLKMYDRGKKSVREEYNFKSLIGGSYRKGTTEFHALLNTDLKNHISDGRKKQNFMKAISHQGHRQRLILV
jgi:hypothetical protein